MTEAKRVVLDFKEKSIHDHLLEMGELAVAGIGRAIDALSALNRDAARDLIRDDSLLNGYQQDIENECLVVLASQQPVAGDLRRVLTGLHLAQELERIADHSADIGRISLSLEQRPDGDMLSSLQQMARHCADMLQAVLQAYDQADPGAARSIAEKDEALNQMQRETTERAMTHMSGTPASIGDYSRLLWIAHDLERIGDRVTNIAERVVFMVTGKTPELGEHGD